MTFHRTVPPPSHFNSLLNFKWYLEKKCCCLRNVMHISTAPVRQSVNRDQILLQDLGQNSQRGDGRNRYSPQGTQVGFKS